MGLEPISLEDYQKTTVTDQFNGTLFSSSGVRWLPPDAIDTYVPDSGIKVTSWFKSFRYRAKTNRFWSTAKLEKE